MPLAACEMAEIARAERRALLVKLSGQMNIGAFQGPDLDPRSGDQRQRRIECLSPVDRQVRMDQFLQHLRGGAQGPPLPDRFAEEVARLVSKRMRLAHRVHEDVGVDERHVSVAPCWRD